VPSLRGWGLHPIAHETLDLSLVFHSLELAFPAKGLQEIPGNLQADQAGRERRAGIRLGYLHIDSHTDAYAYEPADKYNAATQFTHVAEEGLLDASRSWHVGIRGTTFAHGVVARTRELGYRIISLDELVRGGFAQRMAEFRDEAKGRPVYICFDMDVFDPSCAPGVCSPSWGGLSAREGLDLIRCLTDLDIVAVDVATVSPPHDVNGMAAHLCAHVIYEMLVLLARQRGLVG